jgi:hypothetical protein
VNSRIQPNASSTQGPLLNWQLDDGEFVRQVNATFSDERPEEKAA